MSKFNEKQANAMMEQIAKAILEDIFTGDNKETNVYPFPGTETAGTDERINELEAQLCETQERLAEAGLNLSKANKRIEQLESEQVTLKDPSGMTFTMSLETLTKFNKLMA